MQQPLELEDLLRRHSLGSYTGSNVLSLIDERCASIAGGSLSSFFLPSRSKASPLASRSQSFNMTHSLSGSFWAAAADGGWDASSAGHASSDGSSSGTRTSNRGRSLSFGQSLSGDHPQVGHNSGRRSNFM